MMPDWIDELIRTEQLPDDFASAVERIIRPLAESIHALRTSLACPVVIGINGAQGSGKSTLALFLSRWLKQELEIRLNELQESWHMSSLEKIFIEKRIYRDIEECETWEEVIQAIETGLKPYKKLFKRDITRDDIIRLTEIRIVTPSPDRVTTTRSMSTPSTAPTAVSRSCGSFSASSTAKAAATAAGSSTSTRTTNRSPRAAPTLYPPMPPPPMNRSAPSAMTSICHGGRSLRIESLLSACVS